MTPGQTRVLVLLLILLALEAIRHPTVGNGIKSALSGFNTALNSASGGTTPPAKKAGS